MFREVCWDVFVNTSSTYIIALLFWQENLPSFFLWHFSLLNFCAKCFLSRSLQLFYCKENSYRRANFYMPKRLVLLAAFILGVLCTKPFCDGILLMIRCIIFWTSLPFFLGFVWLKILCTERYLVFWTSFSGASETVWLKYLSAVQFTVFWTSFLCGIVWLKSLSAVKSVFWTSFPFGIVWLKCLSFLLKSKLIWTSFLAFCARIVWLKRTRICILKNIFAVLELLSLALFEVHIGILFIICGFFFVLIFEVSLDFLFLLVPGRKHCDV